MYKIILWPNKLLGFLINPNLIVSIFLFCIFFYNFRIEMYTFVTLSLIFNFQTRQLLGTGLFQFPSLSSSLNKMSNSKKKVPQSTAEVGK